jgi:phosphatidylinositol alpha 1,6-mannosyltransferase
MKYPRVALFADCFHEANGVALTCRELDGFARRRGLALLTVRPGPATRGEDSGPVHALELKRSRLAVPVDEGLAFDPLFLRHRGRMRRAVEAFGAAVVHITSPGDMGILGALVAHDLGLPLVASWHTNLHEFGAQRLERLLGFLPQDWRERATGAAGNFILERVLWFYRLPRLLYAPNPELVALLQRRCQRLVLPMARGVDTVLFHPARRTRNDGDLVLGFTGRLRPEKNLRCLVEVERALIAAGHSNCRFVFCGEGSERNWLAANLQRAEFRGVVRGEALAREYANFDLFLFPSRTDTYGNAVQEAMASGVPPVVTASGGAQYLVDDGETGLVAGGGKAFINAVLQLAESPNWREAMAEAARAAAMKRSWDEVFTGVWDGYLRVLRTPPDAGKSSNERHRPETVSVVL